MIYFYNTFHNGDVHYSRSFIRDIMNKINDNFCYLHNNNPNILKDFPKLLHDKAFNSFENWNLITKYPITYYDQIIRDNDNLYINTWVGQQNWLTKNGLDRNRDNRYCSLYSYYELFEDIYKDLSLQINNIDEYVPDIDFHYIEKNNINNFLFINKKFSKKVLLVNNEPRTVRIPIDFSTVAEKLSTKYPDVLFILTNKINIRKENIAYTSDFIALDCDLNEISYLSTFCDIIIGRPSGPYCFCMIKDNFFNDKIFITISDNTYDRYYFTNNNILLSDHSTDGVIEIIEKNIRI